MMVRLLWLGYVLEEGRGHAPHGHADFIGMIQVFMWNCGFKCNAVPLVKRDFFIAETNSYFARQNDSALLPLVRGEIHEIPFNNLSRLNTDLAHVQCPHRIGRGVKSVFRVSLISQQNSLISLPDNLPRRSLILLEEVGNVGFQRL